MSIALFFVWWPVFALVRFFLFVFVCLRFPVYSMERPCPFYCGRIFFRFRFRDLKRHLKKHYPITLCPKCHCSLIEAKDADEHVMGHYRVYKKRSLDQVTQQADNVDAVDESHPVSTNEDRSGDIRADDPSNDLPDDPSDDLANHEPPDELVDPFSMHLATESEDDGAASTARTSRNHRRCFT